MTERHPDEVEDDDGRAEDGRDELGDPASSHGSDLDARVGDGEDRPDQGREQD
jgi:hypothetical protein